MNYSVGTTVGHYKILEPIGAGGMGEVYKALDPRLDRAVALKILPPHLVSDSDRVRRFIGEARAASALNHPNIVAIYDIGEAEPESAPGADSGGKVYFIAMELVEGSTLQAGIHRDKAELKKLLEYFAQAADGLAKAHAAGIVHRDLKPENVMISADGYAKILDFGLAKLLEPNGGASSPSSAGIEEAETAVMARTQAGVVMGTVGYMSPEQAQGKRVDHRSDIFSFGCMLFEAATGLKPFQGDSLIDSLHKIVYAQAPPIRDSNPNAPVELQRIIRKCLAKDPGGRYQSIKDAAIDLRELIKEYDSQPTVSLMFTPGAREGSLHSSASRPLSHTGFGTAGSEGSGQQPTLSSGGVSGIGQAPRSRAARWIAIGAGGLVLAAIALISLYVLVGQKQAKATGPAFESTRITKLTSTGRSLQAVISPDGKYVVHVVNDAGKQALWARQTATNSNVQVVPPDEGNYVGMTFSRDGNYIYFTKGEKGATVRGLYQIAVLGGIPKKLVDDVDSEISFSPDAKRFVFVRHSAAESALVVVNADGSGEQKLATSKQPDIFLEPAWSPDGKVVAASMRKITGGFRFEVVAVQVADGSTNAIPGQKWVGIAGLAWLPDSGGLLLGARDQAPSSHVQIWEISYPEGKTRKITNDLNSYAGVSVSADGSSLVTVQTDTIANILIAQPGEEERARQITQGSGRYDQVTWGPNGSIVYLSDVSGTADIWEMDADGKNQRQLTVDAGINIFPAVSPDGKYIVFCSNRSAGLTSFSVWRMGLDGSSPRRLTEGEGDFFPACSGDGKWVLYNPLGGGTKPTLWKVPIDGGEPVQLIDKTSVRPVVSPDGKFIACQYSEGQPNTPPSLAIIPIEGGPAAKKLNVPMGMLQYRWSADSKAMLYLDQRDGISNIWSQSIDGGQPRQVTRFTSGQIFSFDWSRDGKQLLCTRGTQTTDVILMKDQRREPKE